MLSLTSNSCSWSYPWNLCCMRVTSYCPYLGRSTACGCKPASFCKRMLDSQFISLMLWKAAVNFACNTKFSCQKWRNATVPGKYSKSKLILNIFVFLKVHTIQNMKLQVTAIRAKDFMQPHHQSFLFSIPGSLLTRLLSFGIAITGVYLWDLLLFWDAVWVPK